MNLNSRKVKKMVKGSVILRATAFTVVLLCTTVGMAVADVLNIKADAPTQYVVKKGDTLWDISNIFLSKPWLWPELWRNNTQIENPHLIYPGDMLNLRYEDGKPVIELVRTPGRKKGKRVFSPEGQVTKKPSPISTLPWDLISSFIANDSMMEAHQYEALPGLLGDKNGTPRFSETDYVLTHKLPNTEGSYQVVRKVREVFDSKGNRLGLQVSHLSDAEVSYALSNDRQIVHLTASTLEAKQGDKLKPLEKLVKQDLRLAPANTQVGELVQNINGNSLIAMRDIVIINLGEHDVSPGTVFGIYQKGPDVVTAKEPTYTTNESLLDLFSFKDRVEQPSFKVGELVVIKSFEKASYAWVTKAETYLTGGEIIAKP